MWIFKESLCDEHKMAQVITEVLRFGQLEIIYMGSAAGNAFNYEEYLNSSIDCAVVRVNILDTNILNYDLEQTRILFMSQLENKDHAVKVECNIYSAKRNLSSVDIVIDPHRNIRFRRESRFEAA